VMTTQDYYLETSVFIAIAVITALFPDIYAHKSQQTPVFIALTFI